MKFGKRFSYAEFWWSAVWVVFLTIPVALVRAFSQAGRAWDAIAYCAIAGFGVLIVVASSVNEETLSQWLKKWWQWGGLLVCVALTLPSLRSGATAFIPFFFSAIAFRAGLRGTLISFGLSVLVAVFAPIVDGVSQSSIGWAIGGPIFSLTFVLLIWFLHEKSTRQERARAEAAAVEEREAISRDVHDLLGHTLTIVSLKAQLARRMLRDDPARAETELDALLALVDGALSDVRATVGRLRIPDLAAQLETARDALEQAGIQARVTGSFENLSPSQRALAAWLVREATTNMLRHAQATTAEIAFRTTGVRVSDDGVGIAADEGFGLTGLRRRVDDADGTLSVGPAYPGRARPGTRLDLEFS